MKSLSIHWTKFFLIVLVFNFYNCDKQPEQDLINETFPEAQEEIRDIIDSIILDAETANQDGLKSIHLNTDKFTKFGPRNFNRQDVISTNKSEEDFFGSVLSDPAHRRGPPHGEASLSVRGCFQRK